MALFKDSKTPNLVGSEASQGESLGASSWPSSALCQVSFPLNFESAIIQMNLPNTVKETTIYKVVGHQGDCLKPLQLAPPFINILIHHNLGDVKISVHTQPFELNRDHFASSKTILQEDGTLHSQPSREF